MSKEATVFIIDANPSMVASGNVSKAQHIVSKLLQRKIWSGRKGDQVGILVVGEITSNVVNEEQPDDYEFVYDIGFDIYQDDVLLRMPTGKMLQKLEDLTPTHEGDLMDGIIVGVHMLHQHCISAKTGKPLKYEKKLYLFTDARTSMSTDFYEDMLEQCKNNDVQTMICAFDFETLEVKGDSSNEQHQREEMLKRFVELNEKGVLVDSGEAFEMVSEMQGKSVNPTTTFRGNLTLGDPLSQETYALSIPVWIYNLVVPLKPPTAKKYSKISTEEGMHEVGMDRVYKKEDDEGEFGDFAGETIRAYKYGKHLIPITEEDEKTMALSTTKQIEVVQFVRLADIKREWYMGSIYAVVPAPESKFAKVQFDTMMSAMYEDDVGAIVRYVRSDNGNPKLCLLKYSGEGHACMVQLPFAEDVRPLVQTPNVLDPRTKQEKKLRNYCVDEDVDSKMDAFIDSWMTDHFEPESLHNPSYHYMTRCIVQKALYPSLSVPSDEEFMDKWKPRPKNAFSDELKTCFKLGIEVQDEIMESVTESEEALPPDVPKPVVVVQQVEEPQVVDVFDMFFD
jgi:ATP-dependent DNA helicase 2 subunit 2